MKDIFISFSSKNLEEAKRVCTFLEDNSYTCFLANRDIVPGQEYASQLVEQMEGARVLVLLLSKESNDSPHVLREIEYCVSHKFPIIVYPIEEVKLSKSMEYFLMTHQWISLDDDKDKRLLESIKPYFNAVSLEENKAEDIISDQMSEEDKAKEADRIEYEELIRKTKRTYGKAFLLMIVLVVILFFALYARYILPEKSLKQENPGSEAVENSVSLSDRITFGHYNGEEIEWRVIHINEDDTALLLASQILTIKAFDTAEGGKYNEYEGVDYWSYENHIIDDPTLCIMARGNNDWSKSNIRTWLNSDKEVVDYEDQAPTRKASCTGENYYSNEPGFLYDFTDDEKAALVITKNRTLANQFSDSEDGYVESEDKVFLLSKDELSYLKEAGISVYATVTSQAAERDTSNSVNSFIETHQIENYYWWLRDHEADSKTNEGLIVTTEYEDGEKSLWESWTVGASSFGIRPAITVDLSKLNKQD